MSNETMERMLAMHIEQDELRFSQGEKKFDEINSKLDMLIEAHNKQRGFIAGVSMAFSILASAVVGLAIYIWNNLR